MEKSYTQRCFEAMKRQEEIAKKNLINRFNKSGNVSSSWSRINKEHLVGAGYYVKGTEGKPHKDSLSGKKSNGVKVDNKGNMNLETHVIEIIVRKKNVK